MKKITVWLSLLFLLAACTTVPQADPQHLPVGQPVPISCIQGIGTDANANATAAARCQQDTAATINAINAATAVAQQEAAAAVEAATSQAGAIASATSEAATATGESVVIRITEQAIAFQMADATATAGFQQTRDAAESTRVSAVATAEADNLRLQQLATQREIERQEKNAKFWNVAQYTILVVLVFIVIGLAIYIAVWVWTNRKPVQVVKDENGRVLQVFVMAPDGGLRALSSSQMLLQPPNVAGLIDEAQKNSVTPSWRAFVAHKDRFSVPVGVDSVTQQPIFIDRRRHPHVLFAGASGAGKSASGIIPFALAMWGVNAHVLIVNGKGADYNALNGEDNITMFSRPDTADLLRPLSGLLNALEKEYQRREQVLAQYNVNDWSMLPPTAGEFGEIVIVLEEFLALVEKADEVAELSRMDRDTDKAKEMKLIISQLWFRLSSLVSQARKTGIFLVVALTDVTNDAIGKQATKLKRQMARVVYRMNSAPSSRSLLDIERGSDYAAGTVGFPTGQFLINIEGEVKCGVSFFPRARDIDDFFISRQVRPNPLPDLVLGAIQTESGVWTTGAQEVIATPISHLRLPNNGQTSSPVENDGRKLDSLIAQMTSLNDIARFFSDVPFDERSYRPDGNIIAKRVRPALVWRIRKMNCEKSRALLS
ncbi:MAG: hypothetical protein GY805_24260 [Chloroflexi bacterium]|nr:hypothetical protein [Chloroflexota bacterium]